tara:strand:- start:1572 stop:1760 length:189 start_codon:yes stop_codon:yes gene_type:complete
MGTDDEFIWFNMVLEKLRNHENIQVFCGEGEKWSMGFSPLVLFSGRVGVGLNWNGKTLLADR